MSKFIVLVKQLYKQKVRSKSFILMTLLYVGLIAAFVFWSDIKDLLFSDEATNIAIINETDFDMQSIFVSDHETEWHFIPDAELAEQLEDGTYLAAITLTDAEGKLAATIASFNPLELNDQQSLGLQISTAGQLYAMKQLNLTEQQMALLLDTEPQITMSTMNEQVADGKSTDEKQAGSLISYIIGFLIYLFIITFLSMITTDVASEKGSRALEMLLVSVKPETHFRAKLTGVLLLALTQFAILFIAVFVLLRFTDGGEKWSYVTDILDFVSPMYFIYVMAFVFATLFLYLIIGALFGSLVSKVEEAGQVMMPATIMTIIGFYVMITGMSNPDTMLIKVFSYIPFTSGMVMPMRIGATDINSIEPLLSLVILLVTMLVSFKISMTFYKRSVLTYSSGGLISKIKMVFKVTS